MIGYGRSIGLRVVAAVACCAFSAGCVVAPTDSAPSMFPTQDVVSGIRSDPTLKAELPESIVTRGTIILGVTDPGASSQGLPHDGLDGHRREVGLDVDLRNAVARKLGVRWDIRHGTFATIVPGTQNGRFDVGMANFGVTRARERIVDFATYLTDGQAFLGGRSAPLDHVTTLTDLCGLHIATTPGSTFQQILVDGAARCTAAGRPRYTVQYFADSAPLFLGLVNGRIDVLFGPTLSLRYDARHIADAKFLGQISSTPVGFITAQGSATGKALSDAVNALIADGDYAKIFTKWGVLDTGIPKSQLDPAPNF